MRLQVARTLRAYAIKRGGSSNFVIVAQVVQMNKLPLVVTFVGRENCNTGHILALESQIDTFLEDVKLAVNEA